jgi:hypothetical protein
MTVADLERALRVILLVFLIMLCVYAIRWLA